MENHQNQNYDADTVRILLMGTSAFAVPIFDAINHDDRFVISGVVTQPAKPVGRDKSVTLCPVAEWADELPLRVLFPHTLHDPEFKDEISAINPDVALVVAYGKMIPLDIIHLPLHNTVNVHPSLLPQLRGPSPLQYAILKGLNATGVSIMLIDEHMDHGPILHQFEYPLNGTETYLELSDTLSRLSAPVVPDVLFEYVNQSIQPIDQDHDQHSICKLISTTDGLLFWEKSALELERRVRALNPEPGTYTTIGGKRFKIRAVRMIDQQGPAGQYFEYDDQLAVYCGEDSLIIEEIQPAGKKWISSQEFIRGYGIPV